MSDTPSSQNKPAAASAAVEKALKGDDRAIWARGGWMLVLLILFSVAQTLLVVTAVLQFGWLLFTKKSNPYVKDFGTKLGNWMAMNARFQALDSDEKPFPWSAWK